MSDAGWQRSSLNQKTHGRVKHAAGNSEFGGLITSFQMPQLFRGSRGRDTSVKQVGHDGLFSSAAACDSVACDALPMQNCWWHHRSSIFGQLLALRPTDSDVIYTVEQNDATFNAFPTGPVGSVAVDRSAGFRVGFNYAYNTNTSLLLQYSSWNGSDTDAITRNGTNVLNSRVIHPSTQTTGANSLAASADARMKFDVTDLAFRKSLFHGDCYAVNWLAGFRYGEMGQEFQAQQDVSVATGLVNVKTDIDFTGFGLLGGFDVTGFSQGTGLFCYSNGLFSVLGGDWEANYRQRNQFGGGVVGADLAEFRLTPILDMELGLGWQSGGFRASTGYAASAWLNALKTRTFITDTRNGNRSDVDETLGFIGLTAKIEYLF